MPSLMFVLFVVAPRVTAADATNRNLLPIGEHESLRANAGIGASTPGSVFHNPAGLAHLTQSQLSVSGTTLMYFRSSTDRLIQLDAAVPYDASGFAPIPATLISTYKLGNYTAATAILVPDLLTLDNRQRHTTPSFELTLLQSIRQQTLWLGGSLARRLGDRLAVGISVFGVNRTEISNAFFQFTQSAMPGAVNQTLSSQTIGTLGLTAILGVSYQATDAITLGLRIEPPFLQIRSKANVYQSSLASDGMTTTLTELEKDGVAYNDPRPADIGIGIAIKASAAVTVYVDAALQLPTTFTPIDDPDVGPPDETTLELAPRMSIGIDLQAAPSLSIHTGMFYLWPHLSHFGRMLMRSNV